MGEFKGRAVPAVGEDKGMRYTAFAVALIALILAVLPTKKTVTDSGYWRIETINGVSWLTSPTGEREFLTSVQNVNPRQQSLNSSGPHYQSKHKENWDEKTAAQIKSYGFKAVGAWSHHTIHQHMPYAKDLNVLKWSLLPIESQGWEAEVESVITYQVRPNDKNLIGYYTDNEIDWYEEEANAPKYFGVVNRLLKKHDPNHLNLGVRFNKLPPKSVLVASMGLVDAHSVNCYSTDIADSIRFSRFVYENSGAKVIVSEFSFFSPDNLSGNKNAMWPYGGHVASRKERADYFSKLVEAMAGTPYVLGCDWFQWNDEPPHGRYDGEDLNCGIVSIHDEPYPEMVDAVRNLSHRVNQIHRESN